MPENCKKTHMISDSEHKISKKIKKGKKKKINKMTEDAYVHGSMDRMIKNHMGK